MERKDPIIFSRQAEVGNCRVNRQSTAAFLRVSITALSITTKWRELVFHGNTPCIPEISNQQATYHKRVLQFKSQKDINPPWFSVLFCSVNTQNLALDYFMLKNLDIIYLLDNL